MKKALLILGLLIIAYTTQAQLSSIELRSGFSYNKYKMPKEWKTSYVFSPDFSFLFGFNQDKNISFYLGFNYQERVFEGALENLFDEHQNVASKFESRKENYFCFPLMLNINLYKQRVHLQLAYSYDQLRSSHTNLITERIDGAIYRESRSEKKRSFPKITNGDFSFMLGLSIDVLKLDNFSIKMLPSYQLTNLGHHAYRINLGISYRIRQKNF